MPSKKDKDVEANQPTDAPPESTEPQTGADGEIVGGPRNPQQQVAQRKVQQQQAQVDEVVDIMRTNVEKVLERDHVLSDLDYRAEELQQGASQFEQQAGKLKSKMFWKNAKMMIIMGVIGLVIAFIVIGPYFQKDTSQQQMQLTPMQIQQLQAAQAEPAAAATTAP